MTDKNPSIINIALVGGNRLCIELLEKTTFDYRENRANARIIAVADTDRGSPGMLLAKRLGLLTVTDYHDLYDARHHIQLIIVLNPQKQVFTDILKSRPTRIRILAYDVFNLFWKAIGYEERKLRERNREVETILNGIQDLILVISTEKKIVDVNETFLTKMQFTAREVIGKKCYEVFSKGSPPCVESDINCPLNEVVRNKGPAIRILNRRNQKGERRHFEVTVYPIWEKDGKIQRFIEISRDITERVVKEEEITRRLEKMVAQRTRQLEETHKKLIHQDKMASLGKLSASVVHEINNPIAGILNLILLIKRITEEEHIARDQLEQFGDYLNLMETETRRISRIVSNLLAFSRQAKIEMAPVNVNRLIDKTLLLNMNLLKISNIQIEKQLDRDIPEIIGSADQLQQVFMNIVSNSVEAMEKAACGQLTISTEVSSLKSSVFITFKDTGIGIPEKNLPQLFEPFFTTKKKGKGVGLGLSVAYGIIQEHGGAIQVNSVESQGTVFLIELPIQGKPEAKIEKQGGTHG